MPLDALLDGVERLERLLAVAGQQIETELGVEHVLVEFLKRQRRDGLLLQLIEAALAAFAGRLEYVDDRAANRGNLREAREKRGQRDRRRVCDDLDLGGHGRGFGRGRPYPSVGLFLERAGKIDQHRAVFRIHLQRAPAGGRGTGEKRDLRAFQTLGRQRDHDHGFFFLRADHGGAVGCRGNQLQPRGGFGFVEALDDFAGEQRIAAYYGDKG